MKVLALLLLPITVSTYAQNKSYESYFYKALELSEQGKVDSALYYYTQSIEANSLDAGRAHTAAH